MKKILTLLMLCAALKITAQTQLEPSFFVDTKSDNFKKGIVEIREYLNYKTYLEFQKLLQKGRSNGINADFIKKAYESRGISFKKGKYIIDNEEQRFAFEINERGQFTGIGKFANKEKNTTADYHFTNGKLTEIQTYNSENKRIRTSTFKADAIESITYNNQGKMVQKMETFINLKEGANQIYTNFHKNGNPSKEVNSIKNTTKEFYQNGKLKSERIEGKGSTTYNQDGKIATKRYITEKGSCDETYENGVIQQKICEDRSISETTTYTYKNGKMTAYQVHNRRKKEIRFYNEKNELLETKKE
ncbi:hypothetical protein [Capnocytophaga sp.]|uniref:hypothetical protein n=1 Tax=Capnocytophaga sp. TaxID=44737 RepID=UPI0026DC4AAE|nr:hypothetical protein [Capnocytophaga sp.]MDO5104276.1 hypothetical protein [Capnocytophaga sp.]